MTQPQQFVRFPPCHAADEDGLLMVGGRLTPTWVLSAYQQGIFPWPMVDGSLEVLAWFAPDPRAILPLDEFRASKRVRRRIRSEQFSVSFDSSFRDVVLGCAAPRKYDAETWITSSMFDVYLQLHQMDHAHSVEVWEQGELVGGVLGISLGGLFSAESMFHRSTDASKVALCFLVERLTRQGFQLLDIQQWSPHTARMGAVEIPRDEYLKLLRSALMVDTQFCSR